MQLSSVELFAFHQYPFELLLSIYKFKTSVLSNSRLLNKLKLFLKKLLFQKRRWLGDLPPRKDGILHPPSGCLGTPLPLPQSLSGGRAGGRAGGRTLTSQPKFSRIDRLSNLLRNGAPLLTEKGDSLSL